MRAQPIIFLIPLLLFACKDERESEPTPAQASTFEGTITVDGKEQQMKSCSLSGSGVDELATVTLSGGETLIMPLHERDLTLAGQKLECKGSSDTTKKGSRVTAELDIECSGARELAFTGKLVCSGRG